MNMPENSYSRSLLIALGIHLVLFAVIFIDISPSVPHPQLAVGTSKKETPIVNAVAVNQQAVEAEVARINQERENKEVAENQRQRKLANQAKQAEHRRQEEQQRLHKLQQQVKRDEQQRLAKQREAQAELNKLKQQQQQELKRLETAKKQQQVLAQKRQQEMHRIAELEAKHKLQKQKTAAKTKENPDVVNEEVEKEVQKEVKNEQESDEDSADEEQQQREADAKKKSLEAKEALAKQKALQAATSAKMQDEIDTYKALVTNAIQSHWNYPDDLSNDLSCRLLIKVGPGGVVLNVAVIESSGNSALDRSAEVAVYKASPLPVPTEPELFNRFRELNLRVKPQGKV